MSIADSIIRRFSSDGVSLTRHEFKCAYTATLGVKPAKVAYIVVYCGTIAPASLLNSAHADLPPCMHARAGALGAAAG